MSVRRVAARVTVVCPGCDERRELTARQARKNPKPLCRDCRFPVRREPPDESDYRFWLQWAGVTLNGETAREYVRMHGLPPPLDELAIGLFGPQKATLN